MSKARSAARLAAVQALYQLEMEKAPLAKLLHEFHEHRIGATIEDATYAEADIDLFNDIVKGVDARRDEIDALITAQLAKGWSLDRLDRLVRQVMRAGSYELLARRDIPVGSVINEYLDVTEAFYGSKEKSFINGVLHSVAKVART
jgi:transcription antitermination protein NusB